MRSQTSSSDQMSNLSHVLKYVGPEFPGSSQILDLATKLVGEDQFHLLTTFTRIFLDAGKSFSRALADAVEAIITSRDPDEIMEGTKKNSKQRRAVRRASKAAK